MTKKEKIRILEGALAIVKTGECMCISVNRFRRRENHGIFLSLIDAVKFLSSVGIKIPKAADKYDYWFPLNEEGKAKRISLLKDAIRKLKAK